MEDEGDGEGNGYARESREKEERERMKAEASVPKAPNVSRMKGINRELRELARDAYFVVLAVACREATANGVAGMDR